MGDLKYTKILLSLEAEISEESSQSVRQIIKKIPKPLVFANKWVYISLRQNFGEMHQDAQNFAKKPNFVIVQANRELFIYMSFA